jgi:catechol 2,3-dioxygenase-like lactoylglutathione lyase family enzyme
MRESTAASGSQLMRELLDLQLINTMGATDMSSVSVVAGSRITAIAPQFLVDDLDKAVAYYRDKLGFVVDFTYDSFYAGISRDGAPIHLKCAPKTLSDRTHRKQNEHLDAYIDVAGVEVLFEELQSRGAIIVKRLEQRPWACKDFYVEDVDGYVLCFSEKAA